MTRQQPRLVFPFGGFAVIFSLELGPEFEGSLLTPKTIGLCTHQQQNDWGKNSCTKNKTVAYIMQEKLY